MKFVIADSEKLQQENFHWFKGVKQYTSDEICLSDGSQIFNFYKMETFKNSLKIQLATNKVSMKKNIKINIK